MKKKKARKEHICDHCYHKIKKSETHLKKRQVYVFEEDYMDSISALEFRYHFKCNYKHEQHLKRYEKLYSHLCEFGQIKYLAKWVDFSELKSDGLKFHLTDYFNISNIRFKEGLIKYNTSDMVTDDPFPMYQDFEEEFQFRILKNKS